MSDYLFDRPPADLSDAETRIGLAQLAQRLDGSHGLAVLLAEAEGPLQRYATRCGWTPSDRAKLKTEPASGRNPTSDLLSSSYERSRFLT